MRITIKQMKHLIAEELNAFLKENSTADLLRDLVSSKIDSQGIVEYDNEINKYIEDLLTSGFSKLDQAERVKIEKFANEDSRGALEILRSLFQGDDKLGFDQEERNKLSLIDEWPHEAEKEEKKQFLIDKKIQEKDFNGLFIKGIDFGEIDLSGANMQGAIIRASDLSGVTGLDSANMTGSSCDPETKWPSGFDPEQAGVKMMQIALTRDFCKDITYADNPEYKQMWNNYFNTRLAPHAYLETLETQELIILMCRSARHMFGPVVRELLKRGYHIDEIYCTKFGRC